MTNCGKRTLGSCRPYIQGNQGVWREPLPHLPPSCVWTRRAPSLKSSYSCIRTLRGSRNNTTAPYLHVMCSATHALKERKSTPRLRAHVPLRREGKTPPRDP